MSLRTLVSTLAIGVALPFAASAAETGRTASVSLNGFDLSSPASVAELHREVVETANRVCRDQDGRGVEQLKLRRACVREAVDKAIAKANAPTLAALAEALPASARYSARAYQLSPQLVAAVEQAAGRRTVAGF